jgi:hypothetical protein
MSSSHRAGAGGTRRGDDGGCSPIPGASTSLSSALPRIRQSRAAWQGFRGTGGGLTQDTAYADIKRLRLGSAGRRRYLSRLAKKLSDADIAALPRTSALTRRRSCPGRAGSTRREPRGRVDPGVRSSRHRLEAPSAADCREWCWWSPAARSSALLSREASVRRHRPHPSPSPPERGSSPSAGTSSST